MNTIDISKFCKTKIQAADFATQVTNISEKLFETNFNLEHVVMEIFGLQKKDAFLKLLHEQNATTNADTLKNFLQNLAQMAVSLPVLSLTLAFEPTDETLQALSEWFQLQKNMQVLFDISIDKKLIAGVAINYQGKHADYSVAKQFETITQTVMTTPHPTPQPQQQNAATQSTDSLHLGR